MRRVVLSALLGLVGTVLVSAQSDRIPPGTQVSVRTDEPIDVQSYDNGRIYQGTIARDVVSPEGRVMIPRGSPAELIVRDVSRGELVLDMESVTINGHRYGISTTDQAFNGNGGDQREGVGKNERTGKYIGGGAVLGTILGAIAGGGKGAAIGAVAGAGAGAATQTMTRGRRVDVPAESVITFQLDRPLFVDVRDTGYERGRYHYHRYDRNNGDQYDRDRDRYNNQYR